MKKLIILAVAVLLALPCMSYAGSATSRWDLTIGGYVKFDLQYADQALNPDVTFAERNSGTSDSSRDKYGALTWASGESRLNFLIKGPDTWGAKTSAFIEGDFRRAPAQNMASGTGLGPNGSTYGAFGLRHAFMKFDWPTFSLLMGSSWTLPGALPCFCLLTVNELGPFNKSYFLPQIQAVWQATKQFSWSFGAIAPYDPVKGLSGTPATGIAMDDFARSGWPMFFTEFVYKTDACGKIGPWMLQFGLGGFYGQEKPIIPGSDATNTARWSTGAPGNATYYSATGYDSDNVDMWMATWKTYIPIIPEKKPGQMAGSLGLAFTLFTGQNIRTLIPPPPMIQSLVSYDRNPNDANADFAAPVSTGGWGQLAFYWTNTVWSGFYYGQNRVFLSQARKNAMPASAVERIEHYVVNLVYDPNPAIRLGLEYSRINTHYGRSQRPALDSSGSVNLYHFAAQYFF
ncbi:MAG: hypothetical protein ABIN58_04835 [candidate division WOR-3 bacterium]